MKLLLFFNIIFIIHFTQATEIHQLIPTGNSQKLTSLLQNGADPDAKNEHGQTALHEAIQSRQFNMAQILLEYDADANVRTDVLRTPLLILVTISQNTNDFIPLFQTLRKHKVDLEIANFEGKTPLHLAYETGKADIAEFLIKQGANTEAKDSNGHTPLELGQLDALYIQVKERNIQKVTALLKSGTDPNTRSEDGKIALHEAIQSRQFNMAQILLEHGADANVRTDVLRTPLHTLVNSIENINEFMLWFWPLRRNGANLEGTGFEDKTPLHLAYEQVKIDIAKFLIEQGANTEAKDSKGRTPIELVNISNKSRYEEHMNRLVGTVVERTLQELGVTKSLPKKRNPKLDTKNKCNNVFRLDEFRK